MQKIFSAEQIRRADAYTIQHEPVSSVDLMERAATACFEWIRASMPEKRRIAIVCGTGNNGGDGLVLARLLGSCSSAETYILDFGRHSADFDINLERLKQCQSAKIHCLGISDSLVVSADTELLIDAVFGTGLSRVAEGPYADAIAAMNRCHDALRIAIDVPSGLFADEHTPNGAAVFQADVTLTFQFAKQAFLFAENHHFVGNFVVLPIGLSQDYIDNEPTQRFQVDHISLPDNVANRPKFSHKGTFGHVLLVAGSYGKMGAAILSARACLRTGAGLVTAHIPRKGVDCMQSSFPEAMVSVDAHDELFSAPPSDLERYDVVAVGPGIGTSESTIAALEQLLNRCTAPMVLDADAINCLAKSKVLIDDVPPNSILTPHYKEFQRLAGSWDNDYERLEKQRRFSSEHRVIVVFKGAHTTISLPDGRVFFNTTGNPGMATAGSGDVLTGIIAALLAQGLSPAEAAVCGVFIHGRAGDRAFSDKGNGLIASDIVEGIAAAMKNG